jgi:hypothetical protein
VTNRDCSDAEIDGYIEAAAERREQLATPGAFPKPVERAELPSAVRVEMDVDAAIAARHGISDDGDEPTRINHHQSLSEEMFWRAKDERAAIRRN